MKELESFSVGRLTNSESINYSEQLEADFEELGGETFYTDADFNQLRAEAKEVTAEYKANEKRLQKEEETEELGQVDGLRDGNIFMIDKITGAHEASEDEEDLAAAKRVRIVLDGYKGLAKANYQKETTDTDTLLAKFAQEELLKDAVRIGILKPLQQLSVNNERFKKVYNKRHQKGNTDELYDAKQARKRMENAVKKLSNFVLSQAEVKNSPFFNALLAVINKNRKKHAEIVAIRDGRRAAAKMKASAKNTDEEALNLNAAAQ